MPSLEIVLVRHAATDWSGSRYCGVSDPPLSEAGRADADRLAARWAPVLDRGSHVVSSPSRRAVATAERIAAALGARPVDTDARWREADFGIAEGRTFDELVALAPDLAAALAGGSLVIDWPGGETHADVASRVDAAWADVVAGGQPAIVVTHAGPLMHARAIAEQRPIRASDLVPPGAAIRLEVAVDGPSPATVLPSRP